MWKTPFLALLIQNLSNNLKHIEHLDYLLKNRYNRRGGDREGFDSLDYFAKNEGQKPLHLIKTLPLRSVIQSGDFFENVESF